MKAAQFSRFGGPEVLEIVDLPEPHARAGEIRIRVRAAGVNASDWKKRLGEMDQDLPQTMGYEAAGVVDELGEGVTDVRSERRVRLRRRWRGAGRVRGLERVVPDSEVAGLRRCG